MDNVRDMLIFPMVINPCKGYVDKLEKLQILWNIHVNYIFNIQKERD